MTQINELTAVASVAAGDQFPLWSSANGDTRRVPASVLADYIAQTVSIGKPASQYASPLTGTTVAVTVAGDAWLILTPAGTIAALTITLPTTPLDGQTLRVTSSQTITALTLSGGTVSGAPTTMGATSPFTLAYDGVNSVWRRAE